MAANPVPVQEQSEDGEQRRRTRGAISQRKEWICGILIALLFALWGLHTVGANNIVDTDGARHAMNGAFIHDLLSRGHYDDLLHPSMVLHYAKRYYGHLPALSLPYHPPLFPAFEAIFFLFFGVSVFAARLAVAVAVALSAIGLFRLFFKSYNSVLVAAFAVVTFLTLPYALWLGSDVMLEFPALVFVVLAMHCLSGVDTEYSIGRALLFALLAGAAVWTKQQTVFLGAVPFFYIALMGRWRLFGKPAIWISSLVFLCAVGALVSLSLPVHGVGVNQVASPAGHDHVFVRNLLFYLKIYPGAAGPAGLILFLAFAAAVAGRWVRRRPTALYVAWASAALMVLLFLGPFSARYLFFVFPPLFVLGYAALSDLGRRWPRLRNWSLAASALLLLLAIVSSDYSRVAYMHGPDEAARFLAPLHPKRILYCGGTDGSFIFSYRSLRPPMDTIILAGDKFPASEFTPAALETLARRYAVDYIVLEHAPDLRPRMKHPWEGLLDAPPPSAVAIRDIPLASSDYRWNGYLRIYRFLNTSPAPSEEVTMQMNMIGGSMKFTLAQ